MRQAVKMRQFAGPSDTTLRFSIPATNAYRGVTRASAMEHKVIADAIIKGDSRRR